MQSCKWLVRQLTSTSGQVSRIASISSNRPSISTTRESRAVFAARGSFRRCPVRTATTLSSSPIIASCRKRFTPATAAALALAYKGDVKNKRIVMNIAAAVFPLGLLAFSFSDNFALSLLLMFIIGLAVVSFLATANSSLQLRTPDSLRGRVMSVYTLLFLGMTPIGHAFLGVMAHNIGTAQAVRLTACLCIAVSLILMPRGKRRHA